MMSCRNWYQICEVFPFTVIRHQTMVIIGMNFSTAIKCFYLYVIAAVYLRRYYVLQN